MNDKKEKGKRKKEKEERYYCFSDFSEYPRAENFTNCRNLLGEIKFNHFARVNVNRKYFVHLPFYTSIIQLFRLKPYLNEIPTSKVKQILFVNRLS